MQNPRPFAAMHRVLSHEDGTFEWMGTWDLVPLGVADRLTAHLPHVNREWDVPPGVLVHIVMTNDFPYLRYHLESAIPAVRPE